MQRPAERFSAVGRSAGYGGMKMPSVHKPFFFCCALFFQAQASEDQTRSQPQRHDPEQVAEWELRHFIMY